LCCWVVIICHNSRCMIVIPICLLVLMHYAVSVSLWVSTKCLCYSLFYVTRNDDIAIWLYNLILLPPRNCLQCYDTVVWPIEKHCNHHHTTTVLRLFFRDHPGEPVPEENLWTLCCKGRLTEAVTLTIRLGATPCGLSSAHLHHSPIFYRPDALPAAQPTVKSIVKHRIWGLGKRVSCAKNVYRC